MQSSLVLALRTVVLLVSLVAIPLAAICGSGSWGRVQELCDQGRQKAIEYLYCSSPASSQTSQIVPLAAAESYVAPLEVVAPIVEPPAPIDPPMEVIAQPTRLPNPPFWPRSLPSVPDGVAAVHLSAAPPIPRPPERPGIDPMDSLLRRLKELGAAQYRLETTSQGGDTFRFHCKMISPANPNYIRYFEATSPDQLRAVQHVLEQVEAWSDGREVRR